MLRLALIVLITLAPGRCQQPQEEVLVSDSIKPCPAAQYQRYVDKPLASLDVKSLPEPYRIIGPGMAVTLDYRTDRLNVSHDARGIIRRISCG